MKGALNLNASQHKIFCKVCICVPVACCTTRTTKKAQKKAFWKWHYKQWGQTRTLITSTRRKNTPKSLWMFPIPKDFGRPAPNFSWDLSRFQLGFWSRNRFRIFAIPSHDPSVCLACGVEKLEIYCSQCWEGCQEFRVVRWRDHSVGLLCVVPTHCPHACPQPIWQYDVKWWR